MTTIKIDGDAVVRYGDGKPLPKPPGWDDRGVAQDWTKGEHGLFTGSKPKGGAPQMDPLLSVTYEEQSAVRHYQATFDGVAEIQENPDSQLAQDFANGVAKCPAVEGMVYRGIDMKGLADQPDAIQALWSKRIGKTIRFNEPVSTTPDPAMALRFGEVLFHIVAAPGAARDISPLSVNRKFKEAILAPGRFRVDAVSEGPPITMTLFGPLGTPRRSTVVMLTDMTKGERQWLSIGKGSNV